MSFHSQLDTLPKEKEHYKKVFFEIKTFGWPWAFDNLTLSEDFMEEYAENLNWSKVLRHQDYSVEFEEKFKHNFKSECKSIKGDSTDVDVMTFVSTTSFKNYFLSRLMSSVIEKEDRLIGYKLIFSGPKGKEIFKKFSTTAEFTRSQETKKIYVEFDEETKKNALLIRADTVKKTEIEVIFIS